VAVLVGDFLFAQSSWFLAKLDNLEVSTESLQDCCNAMKAAIVAAWTHFWQASCPLLCSLVCLSVALPIKW